jgi:hypothetical protein
MSATYKTINPSDFAVLREASMLLAFDIVMDEIKKSITWGPIPRIDESAYIINRLDYAPIMWECFLEMTEWGAAISCPRANDEIIIADKEIIDIFIRSIRRLIDALKASLELKISNLLSPQNVHAHHKKHWQQYIEDSYTL